MAKFVYVRWSILKALFIQSSMSSLVLDFYTVKLKMEFKILSMYVGVVVVRVLFFSKYNIKILDKIILYRLFI